MFPEVQCIIQDAIKITPHKGVYYENKRGKCVSQNVVAIIQYPVIITWSHISQYCPYQAHGKVTA